MSVATIPVLPAQPNVRYTAQDAGQRGRAFYEVRDHHLFVQRLGVNVTELGPPTSMKGILAGVAERHGLTVEALKGPRRTGQLARARQEAMWLMMKAGRYSLPQIGAFLGGRDHTTIIHGVRRHQERLTGQTHPQIDKARVRSQVRFYGDRAKKREAAGL